jgi:hypothetical protein
MTRSTFMLLPNAFIGAWFVIVGAVGLFRPTFFFRSDKLAPDRIARNIRIWRWTGGGLIVAGSAVLGIALLSK